MAKPRSPELARSGHTAVDPDAPASTAPLEPDVGTAGARDHLGPVPPDNRPTRATGTDEDKPDLAAFARRLGIRRRRDESRVESTAGDAAGTSDRETDSQQGAGGGWGRLSSVPIRAVSLSLQVTESVLRRSADTIAGIRRRMGSDDPDT